MIKALLINLGMFIQLEALLIALNVVQILGVKMHWHTALLE